MFAKTIFALILLTTQASFGERNDNDDLKDIQETLHNFASYLNSSQQELKLINQQLSEIKDYLKSSSPNAPKHCLEVQEKGNTKSGLYQLQPTYAYEPFLAWCDMETENGGWTYVLNRFDGTQDFYLDWEDYKNGFGNLAEEFWLGLKHIHSLTGLEVNELLIQLEDWNLKKVSARYSSFSIGSESEGYAIKVLGEYSGDAGDSFSYHTGMKFTTKDRDQDRYNGGNCASYRGGGWWYKNCVDSHLTGQYMKGEVAREHEYKIMYWDDFHGPNYSLKKAKMMVRPVKVANEDNDD